MTPATIAGMGKLAGLDVMALTDHNTCGNCRAFCEAAAEYGLLGVPGMELCTLEEVHVVCLFAGLEQAEAFSGMVRDRLGGLRNDRSIFGAQIRMDRDDNVLEEEDAMLAGATDIGCYEVVELVKSYGGVCYPAHIDRPSFSLLSNLGLWDPSMGFPLAELSMGCPEEFPSTRRDLAGVKTIRCSDAHYIEQIADAHQWMELAELSPAAVLEWVKNGGV